MSHSGSLPPSSEAQTRRMPDRMEAGSMLGRYTIEGAIGEGGMGVVYRARDGRLGRKVALKVVQSEENDPDSIERAKRFLREARVAAALDHPNAVSIFDVGEVGQVSFIAMELVNGQLLREFVKAEEPGVPQRLRWLVDIALALAAAHEKRLIHRDVKPENVMIRDDGRVKVLDFGLARKAAPPSEPASDLDRDTIPRIHSDITVTETGQTTLTQVGTLLGTPQYMAPEQIRSEPLDARSDQFSWGVLAYELLAGELPWKGEGIHVMARILAEEPVPLDLKSPAVPEGAARVIMRALSRDADDRYLSMDEVAAALEPYADPASFSDPRSVHHRSLTPRGMVSVRPPGSPAPAADLHRTQRSADFAAPPPNRAPRGPETQRSSPPAANTRPPPRVEVVDAPPEPIRPKGLAFGVGAIALALGSIIAWKAMRHPSHTPTPDEAAATGSAAPSPAATAVTDLPSPRTGNKEALAAYRAGLAELRFGGLRESLEKAATLDPQLAEAHLQWAVDAAEFPLDDSGRTHLRKATELKAQLGERDQLLLEALEPVLLRQPADWVEGGRRLARATDRFPGDAQLWYERAAFAQIAEGPATSVRFAERATTLDPSYAQAMSLVGQNLGYLGRFDEARKVLSGCISIAPTYVTCAQELSRVLDELGACDEEETLARQLAAASPEQAVSQHLLARTLAARGKPEAAVHEALRLRWAALPASERKRYEPEETLALQLLTGDFVSAERTAKEIGAAAEPSRREAEHGRASRHLAHIYLETGRAPEAGREAAAFFARRDAWEPDSRAEDYALSDDAVPPLLSAWREAGGLSRADLAAKRAAWVSAWKQKAPAFYRPYIWVHGFAGLVESEADAREALAELSSYQPLPPFLPFTMGEAAVGRAYLAAGALDDAVTWLERGTRTCRALDLPVEHTRALLWLGMAREAKHDKDGACAAYKAVVSRWGKARPRSVTGEKAVERVRALSCGG